jgi:hypothetical protein
MPKLKNIAGIMSGVTVPMLLRYIETTYPNMKILQIESKGENEFQFVLVDDISLINDNVGGEIQ